MRLTLIKKIGLSAAGIGLLLAPAGAFAFEVAPSPTLACSLAQARFSTAKANLTAIDLQIAGYQRTITSLQTTQATLVSLGLGESATYRSLSSTISYYQNLISNLQTQRSTLAGQYEEAYFSMILACYPQPSS